MMNKISEQMLVSNYSLHITKDECIDRKLALSVLLSLFDGAIVFLPFHSDRHGAI